MKLVVRADDFGYTKAYNDGTIKAIEDGIVNHVDIMLDTPGTLDALERIKSYPWISIGWHAHFWGRPILPPEEVPSMVDLTGKFKFRKDQKQKATCHYDEVLRECRAQMNLCLKILGKVPDCAWIQTLDTDFERARLTVCKEFGIPINIADKPNRAGELVFANEDYRHLNIYMPNQPATVYKVCYDNDYKIRMTYDPVRYYINDEDAIMEKDIVITAWHPGYLDDYILNESSLAEARVIDVRALCSNELKQWIIDNKVELINTRDALYATQEYQNYLRYSHSPLYIEK